MLPIRADMESAPTNGNGFARGLCNTKAKPAIKQNDIFRGSTV